MVRSGAMQRRRFDPRRLRDIRVQDLRERAVRMRQIQYLGAQVTRLRQRPLHGEYLVPLAAFFLLILALLLSRAPGTPTAPDGVSTTTGPVVVGPQGSATVVG